MASTVDVKEVPPRGFDGRGVIPGLYVEPKPAGTNSLASPVGVSGGPMLAAIPGECGFRLCSGLSAADRASLLAGGGDIEREVLRFLNEEDRQAKVHGGYDWEHFDGIIMFSGRTPASFQRFSTSDDGRTVYAEGIFTGEGFKRRGYAKMLREVLYAHLKGKGAEIFRIRVKNSQDAEGLAGSDARDYGAAVVDLGLDPIDNKKKMYGVDLKNVRLKYDTTKVTLG